MQKVSDIFDAWPSVAEFSRDLGVPYPTAFSWKTRGAIPSEHWLAVARTAQARGHSEIDIGLLARLHARAPNSEGESGFSEGRPAESGFSPANGKDNKSRSGHFSRWRHLRVPHFAADEVDRHISALRDEWERR